MLEDSKEGEIEMHTEVAVQKKTRLHRSRKILRKIALTRKGHCLIQKNHEFEQKIDTFARIVRKGLSFGKGAFFDSARLCI